jgi:hypothetical protein
MSLRQAVFQHIDKHPETTFESLITFFPDNKKSTLRKYYYDFIGRKRDEQLPPPKAPKKNGSAKKAKNERPGKPSMRQQVFAYLAGRPDSTVDDLCRKFPQGNRKTLREYRHKWLNRLQPAAEDEATVRQRIFAHLDQHPNDNLNDLKKAFPQYPKLVTAFRQWKQQHQAQPAKKPVPKKPPQRPSPDINVSDKDKIQSLMQAIDNQKTAAKKQKSKLRQFKDQLITSPRTSVTDIARLLKAKLFGK